MFEKQTPYEIFVVARMRAIVASGTSNTELLASAFEVMVNSDFLKDNEKLRLIEGMAGTYFNEKKYDLAISWGKRYLEKITAALRYTTWCTCELSQRRFCQRNSGIESHPR